MRPNRYKHPLRRIVKLEKQNGRWYVVMECTHAAPGRPQDPRRARFYPCPKCFAQVKAAQAAYKTPKPDLMQAFRANLRKKLKGGKFS